MTYAYATSPGDVDRPPTEIGGRAIIAHGGRRTADDAADGCHEPQSRLIGEIGFSSAVLELAHPGAIFVWYVTRQASAQCAWLGALTLRALDRACLVLPPPRSEGLDSLQGARRLA